MSKNMKTGLLSMQRIKNYGSFLQALSLKSILEEHGHEVDFIDIMPGKSYEGIDFYDSGEKDWNNQEFLTFRKKRDELMEQYGKKYLGLTAEKNYSNDYDFAIIGSDEVFNCIGNGNIGFTQQLFGKDVSRYTITYAASCGHTTYEQIKKYNLEEKVKEGLATLKKISVRDKNTYCFVKNIMKSNENIVENLDPVFIYDFKKHIPKIQINEDRYIVIYSYDYRLCNENEVKYIKEFASENGLKTIGLGLYQPWCDKNINVTPFELLEYFKRADYVITDTFHGAVFSIKYNKKFIGISRSSNANKFDDLLSHFHLEERKIKDMHKIQEIMDKDIQYELINQLIKQETDKSKKYIKTELEKAKLSCTNKRE